MKNKHYRIFVILIAAFLLFLPFFWFKPGEMDLGGDSSRLYLYDPIAYLKNYAFYSVSPSGVGAENIGYFMVPFVAFLMVLKYFFTSSTLLIAFFHGLSFSLAFLAIYAIVKELIGETKTKNIAIPEFSAIIAGLVYMLSQTAIQGWDKVLVTHNQFFLNPLMFFLFLKYFKTDKTIYLTIALIITFIFSPNFSFVAAPGFFAFYPLSLLFLILYRLFIFKKKIIWKHLIISLFVFILLHAFHLFPQLVSLFSTGSVLHTTVFSNEGKFDRGLNYFMAIAPNIKVSLNLMNLPQMMKENLLWYFFITFPLIIVVGFLFERKKTAILTGVIFLIVLFFASANITDLGFEFYKKLFNLPGFAIFRNFYGQWGLAFLFFYTILFGQTLAIVLEKIHGKKKYIFASCLMIFLLLSAYPFLNGSLMNKPIWQTKDTYIFMKMDPQYEDFLRFVKGLPIDGKVITLPLTDPGYQIVAGTNNGAYQGPSMISYVSGKQDFAGHQELDRFKEVIADAVAKKEYAQFKELLALLNIRYVVYNADPRIYDKAFPTFPYIDVRKSYPPTQQDYKEFIKALSLKQIKNIDNKYFVFEIGNDSYTPKIFTTKDARFFTKEITDWSVPLSFKNQNQHITYFEPRQIPPTTVDNYILLDQHAVFNQIIKNPNPPHFLHNAFAKTEPASLLYKPLVIKEYYDLKKSQTPDEYIDKRMFLSAKLIFILERWGHDIPLSPEEVSAEKLFENIKQTNQERTLRWELHHANNDWESLLVRYVRDFTESIDTIKQNGDDIWKDQQKFLLNEYIINHKKRFNTIIAGSNKSSEEKIILYKVADKMFSYFEDQLLLPDLRQAKNEYLLPVLEKKDITNALYIKRSDFDTFDTAHFSLLLNEGEVLSSVDQDEQDWVKLDTSSINFSKPGKIEISTKSAYNLMDTAKIISLQQNDTEKVQRQLTVHNGLLWKITEWMPNQTYVLSFEYKSPDTPYAIKFFEESGSGKQKTINQLVNNQLKSTTWKRYQAVFKSGTNVETALLQLERDSDENSLATIAIRNIDLFFVPQPTFIVKSLKTAIKNEALPQITFTKINPTKYTVFVAESKTPYYLVLNQAFNERWRLFQSNEKINAAIIQKYPQSNVAETQQNSQTLDTTFLDDHNKKPLFATAHYGANGGLTNVWYIDPQLLTNKGGYTFTLELITQRYFYLGLIASLITFVCVLWYLIYCLRHHEK